MKRSDQSRVGVKRVCAAVLAVFGLVLFLTGTAGEARAQGDDPSELAAGEAVYATSCAGCHAEDGSGVSGLGRPLTGIASQGDRATHIASITDGKGAMPAFGENLTEEEISASASYVRLSFVEGAASDEQPELAVTGVGTAGLAVVGVAMLAVGAQMVVWSGRRQR